MQVEQIIGRSTRLIAGVLLVTLAIASCERGGQEQQAPAPGEEAGAPPSRAAVPATTEEGRSEDVVTDGSVDVTAREYSFDAPDAIASGWTTFHFTNEGGQTHFLFLYRLPDGKHIADLQRDAVPVFEDVMAALDNGDTDQAGALKMLGDHLPEWYWNIVFSGGVGLTAPGHTSQGTVNLSEPGAYLMECYVKSPDGMFHSAMGMLHEFRVTEASGGGTEPDADVDMTLSNDGIATQGELTPGTHTIRVHYMDNPPGGFPFDVHLARLQDDTDVAALKQWMNWMNVGGLGAPAPAEFLGGAENMPAGSVAYFTVSLEPGRYMWLSEVGAEDGMASQFSVE